MLLGEVATAKGVVDRQEQGCFFAVFLPGIPTLEWREGE